MSVLGHLTTRASQAVLSDTEKASIAKSITTLQSRLNSYFGSNITAQFQFGSSTRGTILPRAMDAHSDIDYMVVFSQGGYTPQTYLDRLRKFVEKYYATSEISQSNPTIVLNLNHIRFELVPALASAWIPGQYQIPNGPSQWQDTNPNDFNGKLTAKNNAHKSLIKPTIRLAKYWNAKAGYVYDSYGFEKWIVDLSFWGCSNQTEYLFHVFDKLGLPSQQGHAQKVQRAKSIIDQVRTYERDNMPANAEAEVKKLIP
ncbi:MAG: nucleotidyltransferase [Microcystis sp. Msp_OC_L_20101000_S702]|uniref:SMODS domain-containing nucleotidyltransferase n=1 Tax=Microcystis sp. Msp_OC_L_20101000_S702 TaxID=2486218 RepID=UPI0011972A5A|nr:hypothetical protein [Microcystis sp. Msp_OC_L_20101000_S702]TRU02987.1 MAG: nucleotidyltransferase [Microcystis sp. Msp_OC_L_20101000_S702]